MPDPRIYGHKMIEGEARLAGEYANLVDRLRDAVAARYEVQNLIGEGTSAMVFRARDIKHGRDVAIKVLRPAVAASIGADRFLSEVRIAARLSHPHVLPLHDSGDANGLLFYVMPYVEGESLRDRLTRDRQLSLEDALHIARDLAAGLQYAHDRGVVHRDVKPENILLASDIACIADFGLATAVRGAALSRLTAEGVAVGTIAYMSPEQAAGDEADARADQYSLACVIYEMLAGVPPFHGVNAQAVIARHRTDPPPALRHLRPTVPLAFDEALSRAMAKLAADRFAGVTSFVQALESAVTASMLTTKQNVAHHSAPAAGVGSVSRRLDRRRALVLTTAALVATGLGSYLVVRSSRALDPSRRVVGAGALDANRLAVAPFLITEPRDSVWANGLVDLLSRNFDGAGPLRTVWPTLVIRAWRGRTDQASAVALAQRTGAGLVLVGQLVRAGSDSSRITASLIDGRSGSQIAEVDIRDESSRVERMADSLTVILLRDLGRVRAIAAVPRSSIGSRSLLALKAFLQGEQYYRANQMSAARDAYENAIALDSSFALAYRRMRSVLRGIGVGEEFDSLSFQYALRAGARNRGLSPRDSLLILADSIAAGYSSLQTADAFAQRLLRRRLTVLDESVARYPDDPEGWYELAEFRHHFGERFSLSQDKALEAFERATQIDSAFGPAYYHIVELSPNLRGVDSARRQVVRYLTTNPSDSRMRLIEALFDTARWRAPDRERLLDSTPSPTLNAAGTILRKWTDPNETAIRLFRRQLANSDVPPDEREITEQMLSLTLLYRGHLREAYRTATPRLLDDVPPTLVFLAQYGVVPNDTLTAHVARWLVSNSYTRLLAALPLAHQRADTAALVRVMARCDSAVADRRRSTPLPLAASYCARSARAYLLLTRRDSAGAATAFSTLPDSVCPFWCAVDRLVASKLLDAVGRTRDAAELLDRNPPVAGVVMISDVLWAAERARIAEQLHDWASADRHRAFVRAAWARADSELAAVPLDRANVSPKR